MKNCVITVDGEECYKFEKEPGTRTISITCTKGVLNGTIIRVSKDNTQSSGGSTINMCEFQVFSKFNFYLFTSFWIPMFCNMENGEYNVFVELILRGHNYKSEGMM